MASPVLFIRGYFCVPNRLVKPLVLILNENNNALEWYWKNSFPLEFPKVENMALKSCFLLSLFDENKNPNNW